MHEKSIKSNFFLNVILTVSTIIVPLITFPYVSRVLLPEGIGKVTFATSIITYFSLLIQLGIPTYGIKAVACTRDDRETLSKTVKGLMIINLTMSFAVYGCFLITLFNIPRLSNDKMLYLILSVTLLTDSLGAEWLYKGLEKYGYITIRSMIFKFIALIGIFIFVKSSIDYYVYGFFTVFASVASNICNFVCLKKYIVKIRINRKDVVVLIKPILMLFAMTVATTVYTNMDNIMIGIMNSEIEVGYYSTAVTIRRALLMIVTSLGAVMLPRTSFYISHNMIEKFNYLSQKAVHFVTLLAIPITAFTIIVADIGIKIYAGESFLPASSVLRIIAPTIILAGWSNITGIQMLVSLNKEKMVVISVVTGAVVDFFLNLLLIPSYKSCGAAFSTVIAEIVVLVIQLIALGKKRVANIINQRWLIYIAANVIPAVLCITIAKLMKMNQILLFVILFVLYFGIYGFILFFLKDSLVEESVKTMQEKYKGSNRRSEK